MPYKYSTALACFFICLISATFPTSAQIFEYENFGENSQTPPPAIKRKGSKGLWLDRSSQNAPSNKQTTQQHNRRTTPSDYKLASPPSYANKRSPHQQNLSKASARDPKGQVESQELSPLSGTQNENGSYRDQKTPRSRFDAPSSSRFSRPSRAPLEAQDSLSFNGLTPLKGNVWQDISIGQLNKVAPHLKLPLHSYTYQDLIAQLFLSEQSAPSGHKQNPLTFQAIRLNTLYRAGLMGVLQSYLKNIPLSNRTPLTKLYTVKVGFAFGRNQADLCEDLFDISGDKSNLPKENFTTLILLKAYCSALTGNIEAAQLTSNIAKEQGIEAKIPFAVIDFLAGLGKPRFTLSSPLSLRDYLFLSLAGGSPPPNLLKIAEPALLHHLSSHKKMAEEQRILAAEKVARIDLLDSKRLAHSYQNARQRGKEGSGLRRANIYQSILLEQDNSRKARKIQMLLQEAKRHNLAFPIATILLKELKKIPVQKDMDWFATPATELAMLAGDYPLGMQWVVISRRVKAGQKGAVANLFILLEILDDHQNIPKKAGLLSATDLAKANFLSPTVLHRLVTVLDALAYNIPIPLWEASSRTPQPQKGYLPPSGALSALKSAAKAKAPARTILMAIEATGKDGPKNVHLIGLRDIIQNLKKAGYEKEARRLGFEALYAIWPQ